MAYTPGYEYDVFVSYASVDDFNLIDDGDGWITELVELLDRMIRSRLGGGDNLNIYFDRHRLASNHGLSTLLDAVRQSATFFAVASSAYNQREWTQREIAEFCEQPDYTNRLFAIEYLPLLPGERYQSILETRKRLAFWERDSAFNVEQTLVRGSATYRARCTQVAQQIATQLFAMRFGSAAPSPGAPERDPATQLTRPSAALTPAAAATPAVTAPHAQAVRLVVGQTAADMEDDAERLKAFFADLGYDVTYLSEIRQGGADFKADATEAMAGATLFVLPIGTHPGRRPKDLPDGYYAAQLDVARDTATPTMVWRRPDVSGANAPVPKHGALIDDDTVIAATYPGFVNQVRYLLEAAARAISAAGKPTSGYIFINADQLDRAAAEHLQDVFVTIGQDTAVPIYDASPHELREDLIERLCDCDTLLLLYGEVGLRWVRAQLSMLSKMRPHMSARIKAVCIGPPAGKSSNLGFRSPDLQILDLNPDWQHSPILDLVNRSS
ncbi:hypothetical protein DLJ53_30990 [Acuticoccus sediminis]|uniref:TIR domain-containing protein n=1 Tax=Acuticoccus sediminis TaxID=2184697 RepID=A0A8B2NKM2_9HYPH|nr:toll/interleukin-1 receptor domain-containing protein [Acuticoccus sediminis]RAH96695.1 hypothetical protein DLJ53_30990 [Acuticoccus sediminis]